MSQNQVRIGVVGATGAVGQSFLKLLEERQFPASEVRLFASKASIGKTYSVLGQTRTVRSLENETDFSGLDLVFFSSGDEISKEWAPLAAKQGAFAIDNSAAFRMSPDHLLCVPEVNGNKLQELSSPQVIANPNCSTIQMVVLLNELQQVENLAKVTVSTYQSVSGAGQQGFDQLDQETKKETVSHPVFSRPIFENSIPQIGSIGANGFTSEEMKMILETKKIMSQPNLKVSAFAVRVPTRIGHAESVWVEFDKSVTQDQVYSQLSQSDDIIFEADPTQFHTVQDAADKNPVYVSRAHQDLDSPNTWIFWCVADNIRKGAALNGIQIAEKLLPRF